MPPLVPHPVPADDLLDYDACDRLPLLDEPSALVARWNSFAVLSRAAAEAGADTVMSGDGADASSRLRRIRLWPSSSPRARCARHGNWPPTTVTHTGRSARRIMTDALKQFVPSGIRDGIGPLVRHGRVTFETLTERTIPPWFTDDFVRRHDLRQRILARQYPLSRSGFLTADALLFSAGDWLNGYAVAPLWRHDEPAIF